MIKNIIGRRHEKEILANVLVAKEAQLLAVYGRRRVGKTFLINEYFTGKADIFTITGMNKVSLKDQLGNFKILFQKQFSDMFPLQEITSWRYAFELISSQIEKQEKKRKVVLFLDELPWLATPKSKFLQNLDFFWNTQWNRNPNLIVILCGSAASWMLQKLIYAKGGLHNRLTRSIRLNPFTLAESKKYLLSRKIKLPDYNILELYMAMGGVPLYLQQVRKGLSATQNINEICFTQDGLLYNEFENLFASLFKNSGNHLKIIKIIAGKRYGISREEIIKKSGLKSGSSLNNTLNELIEAGFIADFVPFGNKRKNVYFKVLDEYTFFYLKWIANIKSTVFSSQNRNHWNQQARSSSWKSWAGYAFEGIVQKHYSMVKRALKIENVPCKVGSWRSMPNSKGGAQIDLLFDRGDGIVSICEIKHSENEFSINKKYSTELENKIRIFSDTFKTRKHLFLVMITTFGLKSNQYSQKIVSNEVSLAELFQ